MALSWSLWVVLLQDVHTTHSIPGHWLGAAIRTLEKATRNIGSRALHLRVGPVADHLYLGKCAQVHSGEFWRSSILLVFPLSQRLVKVASQADFSFQLPFYILFFTRFWWTMVLYFSWHFYDFDRPRRGSGCCVRFSPFFLLGKFEYRCFDM